MSDQPEKLASALAEMEAVARDKQTAADRHRAATCHDSLASVLWLLENGFVTRAKRMVRRMIETAS